MQSVFTTTPETKNKANFCQHTKKLELYQEVLNLMTTFKMALDISFYFPKLYYCFKKQKQKIPHTTAI